MLTESAYELAQGTHKQGSLTNRLVRSCAYAKVSQYIHAVQADDDMDDDRPAGVVSFVPHSANKYPKQKKPRSASSTDQKAAPKPATAPRTLVKAGELVHVATDVPLTAQHDMFGAVDSSTFQVGMLITLCSCVMACDSCRHLDRPCSPTRSCD